jgi:hypothetical protein
VKRGGSDRRGNARAADRRAVRPGHDVRACGRDTRLAHAPRRLGARQPRHARPWGARLAGPERRGWDGCRVAGCAWLSGGRHAAWACNAAKPTLFGPV